ncbi:IS3 family transposase [Marinilactibacillus psychrotolerans]
MQFHLVDYVQWWNHFQSLGSLGYETPIDYRKCVDIHQL